MVKERWIEHRLKYLSSEGKRFSVFFLASALILALVAALFASSCGLILATVLIVSSLLARVIAFTAGVVVKLIATAIWPPARIHILSASIEISQSPILASVFAPLPGVPRSILQS